MRAARRHHIWTFALVIGLIALLFAFWPQARTLYGLTGEEAIDGQLAGIMHWLNTAVRPQPDLAPQAPVLYADVSPFGVNTFLQQEVETEKRELSLQLIKTAGFQFIRQEFTWEDIEIHAKGDFVDRRNDPAGVDAWAKYDHIVDLAERYDLEIIARISNPPAWSRAQSDEAIGALGPPDDFEDFGDFVTALADRYRGRITYYQLWNEPNGNEEWGKRDVDPESFTELLCLGYRRLKATDDEAIVLAGALTPTVANDGRNMNDLIYLQRMYQAGAGECFDIFSAQGYGLWSGPTDQRLRPTVINYPHHLFLRDLMVVNGDAEKPIWISEMGWNVVPEPLPAPFGRVTEEEQARYAVQAYRRAQQEWPWIGVINYWFFKRPGDGEREEPFYYFRLLEPDFTPLPAFSSLATYANAPEDRENVPTWRYDWNRRRPVLFVVGLALTFFSLLHILTPVSREDEA